VTGFSVNNNGREKSLGGESEGDEWLVPVPKLMIRKKGE